MKNIFTNLSNITSSMITRNNFNSKEKHILLKINKIVLIPEFKNLLVMEDDVKHKMMESMKKEGFKQGHEIHVWFRNGEYILIDGHTRLHCWSSLGNDTIPAIIHHFNRIEEAKEFAVMEQIARRNITGESLLKTIKMLDFSKGKGNSVGEKGKASEIIAKKLGVSDKTVEKARIVNKEASEEQLQAIQDGSLSINQVYCQIKKSKSDNKNILSLKEKTFINGILYSINLLQSGKTIKELYDLTKSRFNINEIGDELKKIDFSKLIN